MDMPPKKSRKVAGRDQPKQTSSSSPSHLPSSHSSSDHCSDDGSQRRSLAGSSLLSGICDGICCILAASEASTSSQAPKDKQKRVKKIHYSLDVEKSMLKFLQENPCTGQSISQTSGGQRRRTSCGRTRGWGWARQLTIWGAGLSLSGTTTPASKKKSGDATERE